MPDEKKQTLASRIVVIDGLRGLLVILVVLHHGWTLWPTGGIEDTWPVYRWFVAGNFAVSVFFVLGAFLATRSLLRQAEAGSLRPSSALVRRAVRLGGQMYLLLIVLLIVSVFDETDTYPKAATTDSVLHAATFTFNWFVQNPLVESRPDIGHLWYLSVDMQVFVVVLAIVWLLRRRAVWLVVALATLFFLLALWRSQIYHDDGAYRALLRTAGRADAPIAGALAAALLPFVKLDQQRARLLALVAALSLLPLMYVTGDLDYFFGVPGVLVDIAVGSMLIGLSLAPAHPALTAVFARRPLRFLGRYSLGIYLWHYPVFWFVARHGIEWNWGVRVVVGFAITAVMVTIGQLVAERRVTQIVDSPRWRAMDDGLPAFVIRQARSRWKVGQRSE
ncbi:acyltransferase family protein [Aeromicrobium fastidiosum]|nr:acyltransferase [Aeromicrobium fastidiosum]MBP2392263.1 peptidoglycan/LPS O-acetylase OafA/YrhL [Aeromicrobium fastidiosum]